MSWVHNAKWFVYLNETRLKEISVICDINEHWAIVWRYFDFCVFFLYREAIVDWLDVVIVVNCDGVLHVIRDVEKGRDDRVDIINAVVVVCKNWREIFINEVFVEAEVVDEFVDEFFFPVVRFIG